MKYLGGPGPPFQSDDLMSFADIFHIDTYWPLFNETFWGIKTNLLIIVHRVLFLCNYTKFVNKVQ